MRKKEQPKTSMSQSETFIEAARSLECDESEEHFNEALGKIARHKPKPDKPPEKANLSPVKKRPAK